MTDHQRIEELLALEALDGLDQEDAEALSRALEEHGPDCSECARLRREFGDVAGRLAFALDPVMVKEEIREDIILSGRGRPLRRVFVLQRGLVAAAAALLVLVGVVSGYVLAPRQQPETAALVEFLAQPEVRVVRFEGERGNLAAAISSREGFVFGAELPPVPEGRVYELWMIEEQTATRGVCLEPQDGVVVARFEGPVIGSDVLAVTVESESCPSTPTSDPIFVAPVQV